MAQGRYARWEDFQAMLDGIFTPAYQEELLWAENMDGERFPIFTADGEGRTCFLELERGSSLEYGWADVPDTYELVSQSEDAVEFYLVGHYADLTMQPDETEPARSAQSAGPFVWSAPLAAGGCRNFTCPIE